MFAGFGGILGEGPLYSTTTTNNYHTFVYTYILLRRHKDYELYE
jgi:hypothetical protein